jgi:hypothetical protein
MPPAVAAAVTLGMGLLDSKAKADQQRDQSQSNAEMMRNSQWTKLGAQAAQQEAANRQFNPGSAVTQSIGKGLTTYVGQDAADKAGMKQDMLNERMLKVHEKNAGIGAAEGEYTGQELPQLQQPASLAGGDEGPWSSIHRQQATNKPKFGLGGNYSF